MSEKQKILYVEDEELVRTLGVMVLSTRGEVIEASDGIQALEVLEGVQMGEVGVIVTDLRMPRMDGVELIKRLKENERWKDVPIIVTTGTPEDLERSGLEGLGLVVLAKPYSPLELVRVVGEMISSKG
jgi:CheY-like chemotaxis protein